VTSILILHLHHSISRDITDFEEFGRPRRATNPHELSFTTTGSALKVSTPINYTTNFRNRMLRLLKKREKIKIKEDYTKEEGKKGEDKDKSNSNLIK
jgi:hypothetical protein